MSELLDIWNSAPKGDDLLKGLIDENSDLGKTKPVEPKSAIIDPYNYTGQGGTRQKPAVIPFSTLRRMAMVPAIQAILLTRKNQVARYARRPSFDGDMGFEIRLKDREKKMSEAQRKRAIEIEDFFLRTGAVKNAKRKDNFNTFLRKMVDDTLTLDALVWENVLNMKGSLSEVWALDATTIELVANAPVSDTFDLPVYVPETKRGHKLGNDVAYVQRINGQIVAEYSEDELAYAIRNPRTNLDTADFGMSELEVLVEIVTGIMNGVRYNTAYFNHSSLPQGVLSIVGKYQDKHLEGFKRHWKQITSGASGKWATPILAMDEGQGFQWTPFKNSNRDMEFNEFLEFLFNIACAVYQIDPNEVGFKSWTSSNSMTASDNTEAKMEGSQDKGFVPLMYFLSDTFNSEIVDRIDPEYEFRWIGVDEEDEDKKLERIEKRINMGLSVVAEERKKEDMDDLIDPETGAPAKWTYAPANAQLIQVYMAESGLNQPPQDPNADPNAEADTAQAQADDAHGKQKEMADDSHGKELEKMDKQHDQAKEMEMVKHKNQLALEKEKAKNAPKPVPGKPAGKNLKKSIGTSEDGDTEIILEWDKY